MCRTACLPFGLPVQNCEVVMYEFDLFSTSDPGNCYLLNNPLSSLRVTSVFPRKDLFSAWIRYSRLVFTSKIIQINIFPVRARNHTLKLGETLINGKLW